MEDLHVTKILWEIVQSMLRSERRARILVLLTLAGLNEGKDLLRGRSKSVDHAQTDDDPSEALVYCESRSRMFLVIRSTITSPPRRPCAQSVLPQVKTVPPRVYTPSTA